MLRSQTRYNNNIRGPATEQRFLLLQAAAVEERATASRLAAAAAAAQLAAAHEAALQESEAAADALQAEVWPPPLSCRRLGLAWSFATFLLNFKSL